MTSFNNILVPVDNFPNSFTIVQKAVEFCHESGTSVHLVKRIQQVSLFTILYCRFTGRQTESLRKKKIAARKELRELKSKLTLEGKNIHFVSVVIIKNNFRSFIKQYLLLQKIDLVIKSPIVNLTGTSFFSKPYFSLVRKKTDIPLLLVMGELTQSSSRSMLIPIDAGISERKVREALWIARKHNLQIHIITILDDSKPDVKEYMDSFYHAYKLFSDFGHPPQYKIIMGHHKEEIMLRYAQRHNLSMIFINNDPKPQPLLTNGRKILRLFQSHEKIHELRPIETLKSSA